MFCKRGESRATLSLQRPQLARLFGDPFVLAPFQWDEAQPKTVEEFIKAHGEVTEPFWPGEFTVNEKTTAVYGMANLAGPRWRANVGLRVVRTRQIVDYNIPGDTIPSPHFHSDTTTGYTPIRDSRDYTDALPSANVARHINA